MSDQLGFGFDEILRDQETAHLPGTMKEAIPYYRALIGRHHAAMMTGDGEKTMAIRQEAEDLAVMLNGGQLLGICGGPDGPARILERETSAPPDAVPMWGQKGSFTVDLNGMKVRIEQDGMFGVGHASMFWPGFGAHTVDYQRPFISETGYRSFLGCQAEIVPGVTPASFARQMLAAYLKEHCKGKLSNIERSYAERETARRQETAKAQEPSL
jgi:hypothetical protein